MKFDDIGIVLSLRNFQENAFIITCFTKDHGLVKALIKRPNRKIMLDIGMMIDIKYHARLPEHLGTIRYEIIKSQSPNVAFNKNAIFVLNSMIAMLHNTLHEFDIQKNLYRAMEELMRSLEENVDDLAELLKDYILFEFELLNATGFGLDLSECVATGDNDNLAYISPKSGCAVSQDAGEQYKHLLFPMPQIFLDYRSSACINGCKDALHITEHFINQRIFFPNGNTLPEARLRFKELYKNL
ncbi:MAG: DNA repair protein RecO [Alphaproteobacteria bacterium]|jgi:DNA repair protein RecO (recombination protein O)